MSIRGVKKAVVRAPHVLVGNKSPENLTVIEWTKAIDEAETGIDNIVKHAKSFRDAWLAIVSSQVTIATNFYEIYQPIPETDPCKSVRETPQITLAAAEQYKDVQIEVKNAIDPFLDQIDLSVVQKCNIMKGYIESVKKALKKREHKKIDYDRFTNSLEKLQRKANPSEKDQLHIEKTKKELEKFTTEYRVHDENIQRLLPKILVQLAEFIAPLATILYTIELNILQIAMDFLYPYAQKQGLITSQGSIEVEWSAQFLPVQHQVEQGFNVVKNGKAVKKPMQLPETVPIDQKIKRVFTIKKQKRPPGTSKDGVYRTFADLGSKTNSPNGGSATGSTAASDTTSEVGSENGFSAPQSPDIGSFTIAKNPKMINRSFSYSGVSTYSDGLPKYRAVSDSNSLPIAGEKVRSISVKNDIPEEGVDETGQYEVMTAMYTFVGTQPSDLSFNVGEKIKVYRKNEDDWWEGETLDGKRGEFPGNYMR
ncbi:hypothetical protein V1514DRAFT_364398 [Lipomyces japonicus]|uniref:uncharacterized protein n=1 Tax=Lipomyces japonicus TaxID=56871 RepID=UPI0034CD0DB3